MEKKEAFNNYVSEFCNLDLVEKRKIIIDNLHELLAPMYKVAKDMDNNFDLMINKELLDLKDLNNCSEKDFEEAIFVYINNIQEAFGVILDKISDDYYK